MRERVSSCFFVSKCCLFSECRHWLNKKEAYSKPQRTRKGEWSADGSEDQRGVQTDREGPNYQGRSLDTRGMQSQKVINGGTEEATEMESAQEMAE